MLHHLGTIAHMQSIMGVGLSTAEGGGLGSSDLSRLTSGGQAKRS